NQFLTALRDELRRRGLRVEANAIGPQTRACILNAFAFDVETVRRSRHPGCRIVHRVDGPVDVYRGREEGVGRLVAELNRELADLLRVADVFVAPSLHDPCSNAVLEALACGLPVVYARSGGHAELVHEAGFGYDAIEEAPALLDRLVSELEERRALISIASL